MPRDQKRERGGRLPAPCSTGGRMGSGRQLVGAVPGGRIVAPAGARDSKGGREGNVQRRARTRAVDGRHGAPAPSRHTAPSGGVSGNGGGWQAAGWWQQSRRQGGGNRAGPA